MTLEGFRSSGMREYLFSKVYIISIKTRSKLLDVIFCYLVKKGDKIGSPLTSKLKDIK